MHRRAAWIVTALTLSLAACSSDAGSVDAGRGIDASTGSDAGTGSDVGAGSDAAGVGFDAGSSGSDAGAELDAGALSDAGSEPTDAGALDAASDAGPVDAGTVVDGGGRDAAGDEGPGVCDTTTMPECVSDIACFRPVTCVKVCGGPATACGCCPCAEGSIDDIVCGVPTD